ncbi:MAG: ferrous iron transporter B [Ruminococcaceae bacterium]|nr:ferrous iron transporter B [Oscillospiraceae bacterium]
MDLKIALAGNPNCGKTTLFNALTGSNQFVGNWPGVTVEKKEGKLKRHEGVIVTDLPGIYSLSPYTLEEVVARNYLVEERPDAILNIVDGTNLERNLYLTTQLTELGIPVVVAINMMDILRKNGDKIDIAQISKAIGCPIVEISALKGEGIFEAIELAIEATRQARTIPGHHFSGVVEHAIAHIEEAAVHGLPEEQQRWYAIKIFERDDKVLEKLQMDEETLRHIEKDIVTAERMLDDDAESIIANERYNYISQAIKGAYKRKSSNRLSVSDKIDRVMTHRVAALPIFALIMFLVYFISVSTIGTWVTDFTNDGLFGDGFHFLGIGQRKYEEAIVEYTEAQNAIDAFLDSAYADSGEIKNVDALRNWIETGDQKKIAGVASALGSIAKNIPDGATASLMIENEETLEMEERVYSKADFQAAIDVLMKYKMLRPLPNDYGVWVPGVPVLVGDALAAMNCAPWLESLVLEGVVGGVGAVLGFVPQILVLFIFLAFLEACGYMSRVAFVLDRLFRKFGLSGKSFIPMLVGTGCGVPGIMASRTIENERDRRMTITTTTFIPCGAKLPIIAMIAGLCFGGASKGWWVAPVAYFVGIAAVIVSGLMLKKTRLFAGDPSPFVMELPPYHMPTFGNIMRSMWERGWSFIKKAGTVILLSTIVIWFLSHFGTAEGSFLCDLYAAQEIAFTSLMDHIGNAFAWLFAPLGFNHPTAAVATIMGLLAKEEVVAVFGVTGFRFASALAGFSFLVFNLLCAPCVAAMGAIKREMNSGKWTAFAIGYQCVFAYAVSLMIYRFGQLFSGNIHSAGDIIALVFAFLVLGGMIFLLARPYKEATRLEKSVTPTDEKKQKVSVGKNAK